MKKFGTFSNANIQPRADGYYDRINRERGKPRPIAIRRPSSSYRVSRVKSAVGSTLALLVIASLVGHDLVAQVAFPLAGCAIKGNISYNGGEKIFHVPGQEYYSETKITLLKSERWFCSEAEARAAGWRKARS
jgi:hypothetical protein